jgi:hypothetical protein
MLAFVGFMILLLTALVIVCNKALHDLAHPWPKHDFPPDHGARIRRRGWERPAASRFAKPMAARAQLRGQFVRREKWQRRHS